MPCPRCSNPIEDEWVSCPRCGFALEAPSPEAIVGQMVTKIVGGLVEAGFLYEQYDAEKRGEVDRARAAEVGRRVSKDLETMISDAISTYDYQERSKRRRARSIEVEDEDE